MLPAAAAVRGIFGLVMRALGRLCVCVYESIERESVLVRAVFVCHTIVRQ